MQPLQTTPNQANGQPVQPQPTLEHTSVDLVPNTQSTFSSGWGSHHLNLQMVPNLGLRWARWTLPLNDGRTEVLTWWMVERPKLRRATSHLSIRDLEHFTSNDRAQHLIAIPYPEDPILKNSFPVFKKNKFNIIENRLAQRLEIQYHDQSWYWFDFDLVLILILVWYWLRYRFSIDQDMVWPDLILISSSQSKKSFAAILQRVHSAKLVLQRVHSEFTAQK